MIGLGLPGLGLIGLLSGCAAGQDAADPAVVLREALESHQASMAGLGARPVAAGGEVAEAPPPARSGSAPPAASGTPPTMAGQLVGQAPEAVTGWLGQPRLRREEGSAEIWSYQATQCHLDLVLYREEGPRPALRVAFAAARAVGTARRGEAACLRDIARAATRPGGSGAGGGSPSEEPQPEARAPSAGAAPRLG